MKEKENTIQRKIYTQTVLDLNKLCEGEHLWSVYYG